MTLRVNSNNIQSDTLATISGPRMSNVQITDSSYSVIDDTAVDVAGGYIKITGSNFTSGCQVLIDVTAATSVTFVSSSEVRAQVPAKTAGTYTVYLVNPNGDTAIRVNGLTYSAFPAWSTSSTLPSGSTETLISIQLSAPSNSTVSYALAAGNTLPTGLTLSNVGLLSGTITGLTVETTYNFTVVATDLEYQDTSRAFSITITVGDSYWTYVTTLLSPTLSTLPFNDDASTNNFAVTIAGDTRPYNFNPYTPGYYSATFNGTSGTAIGTFTGPTIGTGDYTIEFWIYHNTLASDQDYYQTYSGTSVNIFLEYDATAGRVRHNLRNDAGTSNFDFNSTVGLVANTWNHLAFVVSGTTAYTFINGNYTTSGATATVTGTRSASYTNTLIGTLYSNARYLNGYMSNFRFVKGTALYTSNFTPPTSPLTAVANTALLLFQSNRFIDNSTNNYTIPPGSASTISSFIPYTPSSSYSTYGSTYFDGNGDYMAVANNAAFNCGTGDFTLECWFYDDGTSTSYPSIFSSTDWATGTGGISLRYNNTGAANKFMVAYYASNGTPTGGSGINELLRTTNTYPTKTWHHVAFVRSAGNVFSLYVNGVRDATTTSSGITIDWSLNANGPKIGGGNWDGANSYIKGYVANLRLVKGTALYTGTTYTVPTTPLTAISGTSLLTCQTNRPVANNTFLDNSTNNFAITRNGNTTQGTFSPYGENWSNYFDGSGDYLSFTNTAGQGVNFGTGDFTVQLWYYMTNNTTNTVYQTFVRQDTATNNFDFGYRPGTSALVLGAGNVGEVTASVTLSLNAWNHIAVSRSGTSLRFFVNGTQVGSTATNSFNFSVTGGTVRIGSSNYDAAHTVYGYLSNIRASKTAEYTANFTPSTTPLQPIAGTSLLTCQSPSIVDNSPNNFTITKNGDVSVQKFGPFAGTTLPTPYYSTYFNGTTDYLTAPATGTTTFQSWNWTGSWTIEGWFNFNSVSATKGLFCYPDLLEAKYDGTNLVFAFRHSNGPAWATNTTTYALQTNTWYHIALVLNGSSMRAYVNGQAIGTASTGIGTGARGSTTGLGEVFVLGANDAYTFGSPDAFMSGLISNFRISNIAVYTGNFSIPTSELELTQSSGTNISALSSGQVSLLTCKNNTLKDNTLNNWTITSATTTVKPISSSPFTMSYSTKQSYTLAVYGGSMYFDGTGDWLTVASTSALGFGTGDYNIEFWLYLSASPASGSKYTLLDFRPSSGANPHTCYVNNSAGTLYLGFFNGTSDVTSSSQPLTVNSWYHCVWARASGTLRIFVNGVQAYSAANSVDYQSARPLNIGASSDTSAREPMTGYMSDLRIIKGQALYTSNFAPGNAPVTAIKNTTLLLNGTSGSIIDASEINEYETLGDAKISTSVVPFSGATSMYFDGSGDYLATVNPGSNFKFGTGNWTIEAWMYSTSSSTAQTIYLIYGTTIDIINIQYNGTTLAPFVQIRATNQASTTITSTVTASLNQWNHIAVVRDSTTTIKLYVNGSLGATATVASTTSFVDTQFAQNPTVGAKTNTVTNYFVGYISDLRVTRGIARYTANFTAPTSAFTTK